MERVQAISRCAVIFRERCCRASYGVLCLEEYNPERTAHIMSQVSVDPRDGKKWAEDQIDWFVKQVSLLDLDGINNSLTECSAGKGENVLSTGILKPYVMKIDPGKEEKVWQTHVVMSTLPRDQLPSSMSQPGAKRLCDIESMLQGRGVELKRKNRHWYSRGDQYVRARFNIKVILGAADVKFQLESKDRKVLSNDHETIKVTWEDAKKTSTIADRAAMYRER